MSGIITPPRPPLPPETTPLVPPPRTVPPVVRRRRSASRGIRLLAVVVVAALTGAAGALGVARFTGWGEQTVVNRYVPSTSSIGTRSADIQAILAQVLPAVVSVKATSTQQNPFYGPDSGTGGEVVASGTGVVVSADGEVVTNAHVVTGASKVTVTLNGSTTEHQATVTGSDESQDLALLKVAGVSGLQTATLADSSKVQVGDDVLAVGYALGLSGGPTVTSGIVSAVGREVSSETSDGSKVTLTGMLQTDAAISSGDSGGPLVNSDAEVIGIDTMVATSSASTAANNVGFAIPAEAVEDVLPSLR